MTNILWTAASLAAMTLFAWMVTRRTDDSEPEEVTHSEPPAFLRIHVPDEEDNDG